MQIFKKIWYTLLTYFGVRRLTPTIYQKENHSIKTKFIQPAAIKIIKTLKSAGYDAFIVGGAIRDILIDAHPKDFDIVTNANPEAIKKLFKRAIIIGRRFKIVHVTINYHTLEVSTFRSKKQGKINQHGMRVNDNAYGEMDEDILRRDFSVNALYFDPVSNQLYDYINTLKDIEEKKIKVIGDPEERFIEDPVRMLRAARLAAKLNFNIDAPCLEAIGKLKDLLAKVSSDRLSLEIQKLFYGGYGQRSLEKLYALGLFSILFPQTQSCIENPKTSIKTQLMLSQAMYNADRRYLSQKSLSTAFLYATLLWWPLKERLRAINPRDKDYYKKFVDACNAVISKQQETTSIPKKIADGVISIWKLQVTFTKGDPLDPERIIRSPRFRAGLDLLTLRAHVNEPVW
ncbi:MAG: poly(A) polymerase, partial [Legionellales bacterium]|nr:poly(A) polymerase [Legionellales bacterium]